MSAEVVVQPSYAGRGASGPNDNGKRWDVHCRRCRWQAQFQWKGGHRHAVRAATDHRCEDAPDLCAGCGGDVLLEPGSPADLWAGSVLLMRVDGVIQLVHDHPTCVGIARV
jgi:hypothetical protein